MENGSRIPKCLFFLKKTFFKKIRIFLHRLIEKVVYLIIILMPVGWPKMENPNADGSA